MSYRGKIKNQTTWEIEKRKNGKKRETKLNWIGEDREKNKVAIIKSITSYKQQLTKIHEVERFLLPR